MATPVTITSPNTTLPLMTTLQEAATNITLEISKSSEGECQLLGPFAILVQAALGGLALLSLVFKRWRERPQRPLKVWAFDVSKQVFGSVLLHLLNLLISMLSSGQVAASAVQRQANPCSFYLLNLGIDTTLGIPILILILRVLTVAASKTPLANPPESIQSGHYGHPPRATWWLKQSLIYFSSQIGMKLCVYALFEICPWLVAVGDWALRWTEGDERLQIAFVMLIFPLIMNALQYYIIDTFIKGKKHDEYEAVAETDDSDQDSNGVSTAVDVDDDVENAKQTAKVQDVRPVLETEDGDSSRTMVEGSASETKKALGKSSR